MQHETFAKKMFYYVTVYKHLPNVLRFWKCSRCSDNKTLAKYFCKYFRHGLKLHVMFPRSYVMKPLWQNSMLTGPMHTMIQVS